MPSGPVPWSCCALEVGGKFESKSVTTRSVSAYLLWGSFLVLAVPTAIHACLGHGGTWIDSFIMACFALSTVLWVASLAAFMLGVGHVRGIEKNLIGIVAQALFFCLTCSIWIHWAQLG